MVRNSLWLIEDKMMQVILKSAAVPKCLQALQVGDFVAIKNTSLNPTQPLAHCLKIKALGRVQAKNHLNIEWDSHFATKTWQYYTNRSDIWQLQAKDWMSQALIEFILENKPQDSKAFLASGYWQKPSLDLRFVWAEFYQNFAKALLKYQHQRQPLVHFILKLADRYQLSYLRAKTFTDICPFTVMGLFNRGMSSQKRRAIAQELADFLQLKHSAPESFDGIPILNNQSSCFFAFNKPSVLNDIERLWQFFATALAYIDDTSEVLQQQFIQQYDQVSQQHAVGWNLSMGLFWLAPYQFVSLDSQSQQYIQQDLKINIAKQGAKGRCSGQDYLTVLFELEHHFQTPYSLARNFPELALYAWEQQGGLKSLANDNDEDLDDMTDVLQERPIQPYALEQIATDGCFLAFTQLQQLEQRLLRKKNLILQGASGTGKTWLAKRLAYAVIGHQSQEHLHVMQFHANTSYEDFVRGWRPLLNAHGQHELQLVDGPFLQLIQKAHNHPDDRFVMVIEEINRGQTAQIFGEMLTLLESSKRHAQEALTLTYAKAQEKIYIPANLYLIATMNSADRSLTALDFALKRRFAFATLTPTFNQAWMTYGLEKGISLDLLHTIAERMQQLNQAIAESPYLGKDLILGHSYFTPSCLIDHENIWYQEIIESEILPLLEEYYLDDAAQFADWRERLLDGAT